jgi:outer membrane protein OmpA-like peptidoglycan-associated protein
MRISTFFLLLACSTPIALNAQNFPANPEPGACYIRCPIEEVSEKASVVTTPAYMQYKTVPPVYKTVPERVLVKEASKRLEYIPAVYREVTDSMLVEEPISTYTINPVKTLDTFQVFEIETAYDAWETRPAIAGCTAKTPGDCDVACYVHHPSVTKKIPVKKILSKPNFVRKAPQKGRYQIIRRKVIETEATVREIEIPAEYITVNRRVLVKDASVDSTKVASLVREEISLVHNRSTNTADGFEWRKIECSLLDFNVLPIYYKSNSDKLNAKAMAVIDDKLLLLMRKRPEIRVEVNSHTDSRSSDDFNLDLSKRRAKSVVDYLVAKGIKRSRLEYHGYGETQLVNHCSNGVKCSDAEHAQNRRTEFRVLPK